MLQLLLCFILSSISFVRASPADSTHIELLCAPVIRESAPVVASKASTPVYRRIQPRSAVVPLDTPMKTAIDTSKYKYVFHSKDEMQAAKATQAIGIVYMVLFGIAALIGIMGFLMRPHDTEGFLAGLVSALMMIFGFGFGAFFLTLGLMTLSKARWQRRFAQQNLTVYSDKSFKRYRAFFNIGTGLMLSGVILGPLISTVFLEISVLILALSALSFLSGIAFYIIGVSLMKRFWMEGFN